VSIASLPMAAALPSKGKAFAGASWVLLIALLLLLTTAGCAGGGTNGTGIEARAVLAEGVVFYQRGEIASGTKVRHEETGASTTVDESGRFSFILELEEGETGATLGFSPPGGGYSGISIDDIPIDVIQVNLRIVVDKRSGRVVSSEVDFERESKGGVIE